MPSRRVSSYCEFADVILHLKNTSAVRQTTNSKGVIASTCYLLGWFLGDLGKHYRNESKMIMDVDIQLTRKQRENLSLGEYVTSCARRLGIGCKRTLDRPSSNSSPNGAFCWAFQRHPMFSWFHLCLLGTEMAGENLVSQSENGLDAACPSGIPSLVSPRPSRLGRGCAFQRQECRYYNITQHRLCQGTLGFLECPLRSALH